MLKDIFATLLAVVVIVGTLWGIVWGFLFGVETMASWGISEGLLYFIGGIGFAVYYKSFWSWFLRFSEEAWIKIHEWIVWR